MRISYSRKRTPVLSGAVQIRQRACRSLSVFCHSKGSLTASRWMTIELETAATSWLMFLYRPEPFQAGFFSLLVKATSASNQESFGSQVSSIRAPRVEAARARRRPVNTSSADPGILHTTSATVLFTITDIERSPTQ